MKIKAYGEGISGITSQEIIHSVVFEIIGRQETSEKGCDNSVEAWRFEYFFAKPFPLL